VIERDNKMEERMDHAAAVSTTGRSAWMQSQLLHAQHVGLLCLSQPCAAVAVACRELWHLTTPAISKAWVMSI
jgi:hypothetical protein